MRVINSSKILKKRILSKKSFLCACVYIMQSARIVTIHALQEEYIVLLLYMYFITCMWKS